MREDPDLRVKKRDLIEAFLDHATFCRESLRVLDRGGSRIPFEQWPSQVKLNELILKQRRAGKPVRIVALKTRRSGFTLGSCSQMFRDVIRRPGRKATIIADKMKPAGLEAFGYLRGFYENYEPIQRHEMQTALPELTGLSEGQHIKMVGDRAIDLLSAEGREVRGGGRHFVLGDEVAFWEAPEITLPGLLNMVPLDLVDTTIILQSTANGIGGEFWKLWQTACDPNNQSGWVPLFFGWLEHPLSVMPVEDPARLQGSLNEEERVLLTMHNASLENLRWRRHAIETVCGGSVDMFHQEYPTTPEEAFLTSGRPALDGKAIARQTGMNGKRGEMQTIEEFPRTRAIFTMREHGVLEIFQLPQQGREYIAGMDPSKGIDVSTAKRGEDPDYSAMPIADAGTGEEVAMLRARLRPAAFARYGAILGAFYNYAFLVPENNDAGFIDALMGTSYPLERVYTMERDPTDSRSARLEEYGFETTTLTRSWLVNAIDEALMDGSVSIHSHVTLSELRTFVIKPNGKAEHAVGCHDDTVLAWALLCIGLRRFHRMRMKAFSPGRTGQGSAKLISKYGQPKRNDDD